MTGGYFSYCDSAVKEDVNRGLKIELLNQKPVVDAKRPSAATCYVATCAAGRWFIYVVNTQAWIIGKFARLAWLRPSTVLKIVCVMITDKRIKQHNALIKGLRLYRSPF